MPKEKCAKQKYHADTHTHADTHRRLFYSIYKTESSILKWICIIPNFSY